MIPGMKQGFTGCRPNERIATALVVEGNLGLRISDILRLRLCDIVRDGVRYRLAIVEQKTGERVFTKGHRKQASAYSKKSVTSSRIFVCQCEQDPRCAH